MLLICCVCIAMMGLRQLSDSVVLIVALIARGMSAGSFATLIMLTIESFPTSVRATALGFCNR